MEGIPQNSMINHSTLQIQTKIYRSVATPFFSLQSNISLIFYSSSLMNYVLSPPLLRAVCPLFLGFFMVFNSQAQISEKAFQAIALGTAETVQIQISNANVTLKSTKGTRILIETTIALSVPNEALLKFVIEGGRYELETKVDASARTLILSRPADQNIIMVKGKECKESVHYVIYIPDQANVYQN